MNVIAQILLMLSGVVILGYALAGLVILFDWVADALDRKLDGLGYLVPLIAAGLILVLSATWLNFHPEPVPTPTQKPVDPERP